MGFIYDIECPGGTFLALAGFTVAPRRRGRNAAEIPPDRLDPEIPAESPTELPNQRPVEIPQETPDENTPESPQEIP